jgi:hypothetical protein
MDRDDVAVLDPEVVANDSVYAGAPIIEIIVCQHDENCVLALLALDKHGVATEELESLHGVVREGDDGVVIVEGVGDAGEC